jgi:ABC-type multidrug transport system ATPase subunit
MVKHCSSDLPTVIEARSLSKTYRGKKTVQALDRVSFTIRRGDIAGYLGPNGAGKTTTIHILLGLATADGGTFSITAERVGFVLDSPSLYPHLTLRENLRFYADIVKADWRIAADRVAQVGLADSMDRRIAEFSLGMKKRAELVRVLLNRPDLIFLDEPLSGLDPIGQKEVREELRNMARDGVTLFITGHDLYNIHHMCNRFLFLSQGRLVHRIDTSALDSAEELEAVYIRTFQEEAAGG